MTAENKVMKEIQVQLVKEDPFLRLWRNNVGKAWVGGPVLKSHEAFTATVLPGDVLIRNARPFHAGLCEYSSDLIGLQRIIITPEMLGRAVGVFAAVEVKHGRGVVSEGQHDFVNMIRALGGIGVVARSIAEAREGINAYRL